jgi:hypothetical protein
VTASPSPAGAPGPAGTPASAGTPGATGTPASTGASGPAGSLAERQAALVAALTSGAPVPEGFDNRYFAAAKAALLRKRAGEVAKRWPALVTALGPTWMPQWRDWAATRPTQGSLRDGWDFARHLAARGTLPTAAGPELATREATHHYDGASDPRPRRLPALKTAAGARALQIAGRVRLL